MLSNAAETFPFIGTEKLREGSRGGERENFIIPNEKMEAQKGSIEVQRFKKVRNSKQ